MVYPSVVFYGVFYGVSAIFNRILEGENSILKNGIIALKVLEGFCLASSKAFLCNFSKSGL